MKAQAIKYLNNLVTDETTKKEIDLIDFIKKCVREFKEEEKTTNTPDWQNYFNTLWKIYPRKINRQLALRSFEHKIRGLNDEECRAKCNQIYKLEIRYIKECQDSDRELQYILHFSSWLNANVPNSPHYKGR